MPNFSSDLFVGSIEETHNSFAILADSSSDTLEDIDLLDQLGSPIHSSSRRSNRSLRTKAPQSLTILSMNCNSIKGKEKNCEFHALIDQHQPDIILGCESKIDNTFATYSLFPSHYTEVYRKDRTKHGGGVCCAIKDGILTIEETALGKDNKCVWSYIQFAKSQKFYLKSFYPPPRAPIESLDLFDESLNDLFNRKTNTHPNVIVAGDFNAPDISWETDEITGNNDTVNARRLQAITE